MADASDVLRLPPERRALGQKPAGSPEHSDALAARRLPNEIVTTMKAAGYDVRETDPFAPEQTFGIDCRRRSADRRAHAAMWESMREPVVETFPKRPALPEEQGRVSAIRRRHLQERCLPLAVDRRLQRHARR